MFQTAAVAVWKASATDRTSGRFGLKLGGSHLVATARFTSKTLLLVAAAPFVLVLSATPSFAQDVTGAAEPQKTLSPETAPTAEDTGDDIVVTGSLFRGADTGPSPVTTLTAATLQQRGINTAAITASTRSVRSAAVTSSPRFSKSTCRSSTNS
ncbi:hypothetical protein U1707_05230 [Sphingomonas sp. PB2P12]